jgi:hypothetical protein
MDVIRPRKGHMVVSINLTLTVNGPLFYKQSRTACLACNSYIRTGSTDLIMG